MLTNYHYPRIPTPILFSTSTNFVWPLTIPSPASDFPPSPPPLRVSDITDEWEYKVDKILDSRFFGQWKYLKYLVQFRGEEASWQLANNLTNCDRLLANFHTRYPDKPGPETHDTSGLRKGVLSRFHC